MRLCLAPRTEVQPDLEVAFQLLEETLTIPDHCPPLSCEVSRACLVLKFSPDHLGYLPCVYLLFSVQGPPVSPKPGSDYSSQANSETFGQNFRQQAI